MDVVFELTVSDLTGTVRGTITSMTIHLGDPSNGKAQGTVQLDQDTPDFMRDLAAIAVESMSRALRNRHVKDGDSLGTINRSEVNPEVKR